MRVSGLRIHATVPSGTGAECTIGALSFPTVPGAGSLEIMSRL
jgi:hypothetical protein